jgi:hypothetical protein
MAKLNDQEREMFVGALNVGVELSQSEHEQHNHLGTIIAGLCAIINKYVDIDDPGVPIRQTKAS